MKKTIVFSFIALSLYANSDYVPLSQLSEDKKNEYNFVNKKPIIESTKKDNYSSVTKQNNEILQPVKSIEKKEEIKDVTEESEITSNVNKNENILNDYKKDNILKDTRVKNDNNNNKDFSITPKFTYSYLKTDIYATDRITVIDKEGVLIPEITFKYKNHNLKAEGFETNSYFNKVLSNGSDLETTVNWNKLSYLYSYYNINFGLAYNDFNLNWQQVTPYFIDEDREEFPSFELHMKNSNDILQAEYGFSYGKNNNINISYEYYLNVGYKLLKDNDLILSAGYKNKAIEYDYPEHEADYEYRFDGPTISLGGTF